MERSVFLLMSYSLALFTGLDKRSYVTFCWNKQASLLFGCVYCVFVNVNRSSFASDINSLNVSFSNMQQHVGVP